MACGPAGPSLQPTSAAQQSRGSGEPSSTGHVLLAGGAITAIDAGHAQGPWVHPALAPPYRKSFITTASPATPLQGTPLAQWLDNVCSTFEPCCPPARLNGSTGASKKAVSKLMVDAGQAAAWYQDRVFRNLTCKRIQVDEIWAFVYAKQKNVASAKKAPPEAGDVWTWTAIDADTKLIPSWFVGGRDSDAAIIFMDDLASRLANRVQLTSDGHKAYLEAVEGGFGADIDYAMLVKLYGESPEAEKRYSPAVCIGAHKTKIEGNPDPKYISTSFAERSNLNVRCTPAALLG
jgi:IS1 family transposase